MVSLQAIDDPNAREHPASFTVLALAEMGEYDQAKKVARQHIPAETLNRILSIIATCQSANGDLAQAMRTVDELSVEWRERVLAGVAIKQAQRGDVDDALDLLGQLSSPGQQDRVRRWLAGAQAEAGDVDKAEATVASIGDDYERGEATAALARIKTGKPMPLEEIESPFLRAYLRSLVMFGTDRPCISFAIDAIAVAKQKNVEQLDDLIRRSLADGEQAPSPAPATSRLLVCVALMMAERSDGARAMAERFLDVADNEIIKVSSLFGRPVLGYLFTRLGLEEELSLLIAESSTDRFSIIMSVGVADAEMGNWRSLEDDYHGISDSEDRVSLSVGVLTGLRGSPRSTVPDVLY